MVDKTNKKSIDVANYRPPSASSERLSSFEAPEVEQNTRHWWQSQFNTMLFAFAALFLAALAFIVLSPSPDSASVNTIVSSEGEVLAEANLQAESERLNTEAGQTPFNEQRQLQARTDSQDVLAKLLASKSDLQNRLVEQWANEQYEAAIAAADLGDQAYSRQQFIDALQQYQSSLEQFEQIKQSIPQVVQDKTVKGLQALNDGKRSLSESYFREVLLIDANNDAAKIGLERSRTLDEVLALVQRAAERERAYADSDELELIELALKDYQTAVTLDAQAQVATQGITRVENLIADKKYRDAMSEGFYSLFKRRFSTAKSNFSTALELKPNDATALSAYQQSLASDQRASISSLLSNAKKFEKAEQWANALGNYQTILQRDPNQVTARVGKVRTQVRLEMDQTLEALIADPLALAQANQKAKAEQALSEAKALTQKGSRLDKQIAKLEGALSNLEVDLVVQLSSDQLTEIFLQKVGSRKLKLGKFSLKKVSLSPGRYVLSGQRLGFKDVRQEIELHANGKAQYYLASNEPIGGS